MNNIQESTWQSIINVNIMNNIQSGVLKFDQLLMSQTRENSDTPPFVQKFGLKYYMSFLDTFLTILIFEVTGSVPLMGFFRALRFLGYFLPIKKDTGPTYTKYHNSHLYYTFPLVAHCISTISFLIFTWYRYDDIIDGAPNKIGFILVYITIIPLHLNTCHQLFHRNQTIFRYLSYLTLPIHQFATYPIEHLYFHHKLVGTQKDAVTSPKNMSIYRYFFKVLFSSYLLNFRYSKKIFCGCILLNISYIGILIMGAYQERLNWENGVNKVGYFVMLSYLSIFIMEIIEYIQHYGLIYRRSDEDSKVSEICSWNTEYNPMLNWAVFKFQSHSDHHMNAYKIYQTMLINQKMPIFPFDFLIGLIIALIPPLWFMVMNPFVDEVIEGKKVTKSHQSFVKYTANFIRILVPGITLYNAISYALVN